MPTQSSRSNRMQKPLALRSTKAMSISAKAMSADVGAAAAVARELAPRSRSRTGCRLNGAAVRSRTAQLAACRGMQVRPAGPGKSRNLVQPDHQAELRGAGRNSEPSYRQRDPSPGRAAKGVLRAAVRKMNRCLRGASCLIHALVNAAGLSNLARGALDFLTF
jgi:hypothetical protein